MCVSSAPRAIVFRAILISCDAVLLVVGVIRLSNLPIPISVQLRIVGLHRCYGDLLLPWWWMLCLRYLCVVQVGMRPMTPVL